jgi:hypothetical protein
MVDIDAGPCRLSDHVGGTDTAWEGDNAVGLPFEHPGVAPWAGALAVLVPIGAADKALNLGLPGGPFAGEGVDAGRAALHQFGYGSRGVDSVESAPDLRGTSEGSTAAYNDFHGMYFIRV